MSLQNLSSFLHNILMPEVTLYLLWGLLGLETFRDKVDTPNIIAICILFYCSYSCIQILVGDCHFLDGVPTATLLDLDDLPVSWKLVSDLSHSRHADICKLNGEVSVFISYNPLARGRSQRRILKECKVSSVIRYPEGWENNLPWRSMFYPQHILCNLLLFRNWQ